MADAKISALTNLTAADAINDMIPIVDVSDTPPASGNTKRISINNLLSSSPTASGALTVTGLVTAGSATITGDLTVDTSTLKVDSTLNKVGIGVATLTGLSTLNVAGDVAITSDLVLKNGSGTAQGYIFGSSGLNYRVIASNPHVWQEGGTDLMRLNSTGLGIGVAPVTDCKLTVRGGSIFDRGVGGGSPQLLLSLAASSGGNYGQISNTGTRWALGFGGTLTTVGTEALVWDSSGNVGIGVTPSASWVTYKALEFDTGIVSGSSSMALNRNCYFDGVNWRYKVTTSFGIAQYQLSGNGNHIWNIASSGNAGAAINGGTGAWTEAMKLDTSGNLILSPSNTPATLTTNGQLTVNATSNTNLRFSYRGSDGTTRVANITLA